MSSTEVKKAAALKGGEWLVKTSSPFETFIPEDFTEEQKMIRDMCDQFLNIEVMPILDRIDNLEPGLMKSLLKKAGEQGLLSVAFPEEYGGLGKDFVTATIVNDNPMPGEEREYKPGFNERTGELIEDYGLITVKPGVTDETTLMILAGIKSEGTQAAAEYVTKKEYLHILNRRLQHLSVPAGMPKYYQVLLKVDVDNGIPTTASILAIHKLEVTRN